MGVRNVVFALAALACLVQTARAQACTEIYSSDWVPNDACCTPNSPCGFGRGDCDSDADCADGLVCGADNCNALGLGVEYPNNQWDCCVAPSGGNQQVYTANEHSNINFDDCNADWSRCSSRSRQSQHFIVYWQREHGSDPGASSVPAEFRVDVDDLLTKAEGYFNLNVGLLNFATLGDTNLDTYKISIFIFYQTEWLATGGGYDDVVGGLWVSPNTMQPTGYTIAHEIGHSFQYQVFADHRGGSGYRYGFGPNGEGGNGYWEATANWQANKAYPSEIFNYNFDVYKEEFHRHFHHEHYRYQSLFMNYYWTAKHGDAFIGTLWQSSQQYEDAIETYMRITGTSLTKFYEELYDACARFVTWDLDELRVRGASRVGQLQWKETELGTQRFRVHYDKAPDTTGYNVVRLNVPPSGTGVTTPSASCLGNPSSPGFTPDGECCDKYQCGINEGECDLDSQCAGDLVCGGAGTCAAAWGRSNPLYSTYSGWNCCVQPNGATTRNRLVSTEFTGIPNAAGFNNVDASRADWRYGYVALLDDSTRVYSPMYQGSSQTVDFVVPDGCTSSCQLYFVVVGTPKTYSRHEWDEDNTNDDQWPFEVAFTNTNLFGRTTPGVEPEDIEIRYDVTIAQSTGFDGPRVEMTVSDKAALANAFGISPSEISDKVGDGSIKFYAVENNDQLEATTTANGYGHWFDSNGDVVYFGTDARLFCEFDRYVQWFQIGQYPGQVSNGDSFRIRQALVYNIDSSTTVQATITFNVRITASGSGNGVSTSTVVVGAGVAGLGLLGGLGGVALRRRRRKKNSEAMNYSERAEMPQLGTSSAGQPVEA